MSQNIWTLTQALFRNSYKVNNWICVHFVVFWQVQDNIGAPMFIFAWVITEIIRYTFYLTALIGQVPYVLQWCRYEHLLLKSFSYCTPVWIWRKTHAKETNTSPLSRRKSLENAKYRWTIASHNKICQER